MVSKKWQASNSWIQHAILISVGFSFYFWWHQDLLLWQKLVYPLLSLLITGIVGGYLHKRYANRMVKVFLVEFGDLSWLVQRELKARYIPFIKRTDAESVEIEIRSKGISVKVESFPLNMMMDDHLKPVPATKITFTPIRQQRPFIATLCDAIDSAFSSSSPAVMPTD